MEVSVLCAGLQPLLPRPIPFPSTSSSPARAHSSSAIAKPNNTRLTHATTTTTTTIVEEAHNNGQVSVQRRHSKSYLARQSAISQVQHSSDFLSALSRLEGVLKVQDLNAILRHFGMQKRWHDLSKLFDWMQQNGKISASSYSSYIKYMGESLNPVGALAIYNRIEDALTKTNVFVCNSVLGSLVRNGKFDSSINLFNQMKQDGLKPDVVTYSTVCLTSYQISSVCFLGIIISKV